MSKRVRDFAVPSPAEVKWWASIPTVRRKLRFYADHQFPRESVELLRGRHVDVWYVQEHPEARHQSDDYHYQRAREMKRLLITQDNDYFDDSRHPLHLSPGVIVVDVGASRDPEMPAALLHVFVAPFLRDGISRIPNLWRASKLRISREQLLHRYRGWDSVVYDSILWKSPARRRAW